MKAAIARVILEGHAAKGQLNGYRRSIRIMTNREYAIKKINEVIEQVDDTRLAEILIEVVGFPMACEWCLDGEIFGESDCTYGIRKWLQLDDTSRQR